MQLEQHFFEGVNNKTHRNSSPVYLQLGGSASPSTVGGPSKPRLLMASQLMWTLTARTTPLSGQMMRAAASKSKHLRDLLPATTSARSASTASDVDSIPTEKRVVIIGGGVIGCSVAYNLGKLGWGKDTLLLEQNKLTSGTTWHAAGLIGTARATEAETSLSVAGLHTVKSIHEETGQSTGYKQCGYGVGRIVAASRLSDLNFCVFAVAAP